MPASQAAGPARRPRIAAPAGAAQMLTEMAAAGHCPDVDVVTLDGAVAGAAADVVWFSHLPHGWRGEGQRNAAPVLDALGHVPGLRWVHTDSVGVNYLPLDTLASRGVVVTNGGDNFARPMAEWVVLSLLYRAKRLGPTQRASDAGRWDRQLDQEELAGLQVLFLGLGSFSRIAAQMLAPFGVDVTAWVRRPRAECPPGVRALVHGDAWRDRLPETDMLVVGVPLTPATDGLVDAQVLASLPGGAWVVNLARGRILDETALVAALDRGHLGGAVLDTFAQEPLPAGHSLWGRQNVLVVPHATNVSPRTRQRAAGRFLGLLDRYARGVPFEEVVDLAAGY